MKINDEARRLKVENSKLFSQYACVETSLTKYKAEYHAKSEETDSYAKSGGEKNNEPESSSASSEQIIPAAICKEKISLGSSVNSIDIDKLLSSNLESIMPKEKVGYSAHKKYINKEEVPDRLGIAPKYINREE
ncbi:21839_t:CDS:2, partial [Gigaspora margarita]